MFLVFLFCLILLYFLLSLKYLKYLDKYSFCRKRKSVLTNIVSCKPRQCEYIYLFFTLLYNAYSIYLGTNLNISKLVKSRQMHSMKKSGRNKSELDHTCEMCQCRGRRKALPIPIKKKIRIGPDSLYLLGNFCYEKVHVTLTCTRLTPLAHV